jgi:hypothetical protein
MLWKEFLPSSLREVMFIETEGVQHVSDFEGALNCQNRCGSDRSRREWIGAMT